MFGSVVTDGLYAAGEVGVKAQLPCHVCGGDDYSWGNMTAQGISFIPDNATWLARFFRLGVKLRARRCSSCGNIQAFA